MSIKMSEDTYSDDGMECPHCNHVNAPKEAGDWSEDTNSQWCESCDEEFKTICYVSHSWTSTKLTKEIGA